MTTKQILNRAIKKIKAEQKRWNDSNDDRSLHHLIALNSGWNFAIKRLEKELELLEKRNQNR